MFQEECHLRGRIVLFLSLSMQPALNSLLLQSRSPERSPRQSLKKTLLEVKVWVGKMVGSFYFYGQVRKKKDY